MAQNADMESKLAAGALSVDRIVAGVLADKISLDSVFHGISSRFSQVKFGCSKAILRLSEKHPELIYGKLNRVVQLLSNDNQIFVWVATAVLGNLASVDAPRRIKGHLKKLYAFLASGKLITANNAIGALGKIALVFEEERENIIAKLLEVERRSFETEECKNIAIGKTLLALEVFCDTRNTAKAVLEFAVRQMNNTRNATAKKAKKFVRKFGPQ